MPDPEPSIEQHPDAPTRIHAVVNDCLRRRAAGEAIGDDELIAANPGLMPGLGEELRKLGLINAARMNAERNVSDLEQAPDSTVARQYATVSAALNDEVTGPLHPPDKEVAATLRRKELEWLPDRYEILDEVGSPGGMGIVYRGKHRLLNKPVAIKFCLPRAQIDRFKREAQLLARVRSPHIVPVYDFDVLPDKRALLVMEWIEGTDLAKELSHSDGALPEQTVLPWMSDVCRGMHAAAEEHIVHRDLKPSNILIRKPQNQALVADFGLAVAGQTEQLTSDGNLLGTPHYMAPEQAEDPRNVDTRTDIYAFGATFYHALTGRPPFLGQSYFSVLLKHKTEPVVAPQARNPALSYRLSELLERCLAKSPNERFGSFVEISDILQRSCSGAPDSPWETSEDRQLNHYFEKYLARRRLYQDGVAYLPTPDIYSFPGQRTLTIGYGDLVAQKVDALVSSDDAMLSMGGGVSDAIRRHAGPTLEEETQRLVPVRIGRAVVTSAGKLPARFIFHAVTMGWDLSQTQDAAASKPIRPSRDIIHEIMQSCFYHADTLAVKSIAFPLLGTGAGGLSAHVCLDTMFRFLCRKFLREPTSVGSAHIVLFDRKASGATHNVNKLQ